MKKEEVYNKILGIVRSIASKKGEGALFIISDEKSFKNSYTRLYPKILKSVSISTKGIEPVIEKLASLDGAILITNKGKFFDYGAMIKFTRAVRGYGTKHAAAAGFTKRFEGSTAIVIPEKLDWIRVFKNGRIVLEMDSGKKPLSIKKKVISFLADNDTALLTTAGVSAALFGIAPVLILSGTYLFVKTATGIIRKSLARMK